jgi:uncharacterized protein
VSRHGEGSWAEPIYLDASALIKLFVPEPESDALNERLQEAKDVVVSDLALTEVASALGRRVRERLVAPAAARRVMRAATDLAESLRRAELTPPVHRRAERLLLTSSHQALRALDALHLALALQSDAATFVSYDERLARAAGAHHLFVVPRDPGGVRL